MFFLVLVRFNVRLVLLYHLFIVRISKVWLSSVYCVKRELISPNKGWWWSVCFCCDWVWTITPQICMFTANELILTDQTWAHHSQNPLIMQTTLPHSDEYLQYNTVFVHLATCMYIMRSLLKINPLRYFVRLQNLVQPYILHLLWVCKCRADFAIVQIVFAVKQVYFSDPIGRLLWL